MSPPVALFPNLEQTSAPNGISEATGAVLLVEDDESLADLLKHLLGRMKVRVLHASTGAIAVKLFAENRASVALAFVDCHLPDSEGGELCMQLRKISPGVPLLLTSGRDQRALETIFAAGGPCSFLAKPYMPAEVMGRVKTMLSKVA
jgi:two-component system cell cycle sensor histidine kinase/response regulator CckA